MPISAFAISVADLRAPLVAYTRSALGERHEATRNAEKIDNREMLARLRHHAVIGRDRQQHEVDAGRAGKHVVHELLVARGWTSTKPITSAPGAGR